MEFQEGQVERFGNVERAFPGIAKESDPAKLESFIKDLRAFGEGKE